MKTSNYMPDYILSALKKRLKAGVCISMGIGLLMVSSVYNPEACAKTQRNGNPNAAPRGINPPPRANQYFGIEQTLSDGAQRNTIAFDALGFLTGSMCADTFLPPGKVSDFFGFQFLRDNDPDQMGHNTDFVTKSANNVLHILNQAQIEQLVAVAKSQADKINRYGYSRFPLIKAFRRLQAGDLPSGATDLDKSAVMAYSAGLYKLDAEISMERAKLFGSIIRSLDQNQRQYLDNMTKVGMLSWAVLPDQIDKREYSHDVHVAIMTYASEMFAWYKGSVEADTYFCPERQGTYFGSFYLKDIPAMGNANYTLDSNLTANSGDMLLQSLSRNQADLIAGLVETQRSDLKAIVATRSAISTELRNYLKTDSIDSSKVMSLAKKYGELDGAIVYNYATTFCAVSKTLTDAQKSALRGIRNLDNTCKGAYLYSSPIEMPEIMNTDFLFGIGSPKSVDSVKIPENSSINDKVKSILSGYDKTRLTESDAKAINRAFRDAGIKKGPELRDAITAAGFDPEILRKLNPPPEGEKNRGNHDSNDKRK